MAATLSSGEYFGATQKAIHLGGISLYQQQYAPLSASPVHAHQHTHFCFTLAGAFHEITQRDKLLIPAGQLLIYPGRREHQTVMAQGARSCLFIEFNDEWLYKLKDTRIQFDHFSVIHASTVTHLFSRIFHEFSHPGNASDLLLEGLLLEAVVEVSRSDLQIKRMVPPLLKKISRLLEEQYAEKWTLALLAAQVDFHPVYLNKLFKTHFGTTIHQYLEDLRLERVCEKLRTTRDSITDIAFECGFNDASHLYKVFLKKKGLRPMAYKSQAGSLS